MTPDQLQQIIYRMTTGPWYNSQSYMWNSRSEVVCESDTIEPEDRDGIVALRNHASALIEVASAAQVYRHGILQREYDEREWCAAGQTVSADQLRVRAEILDAALKRLEEIK